MYQNERERLIERELYSEDAVDAEESFEDQSAEREGEPSEGEQDGDPTE